MPNQAKKCLLIDLGNSKCRFALTAGDSLQIVWTVATAELPDAVMPAELAADLPNCEAWLASVVKPLNDPLRGNLLTAGLPHLHLVESSERIIPHRLLTPQTTGVDRLLAARAARDMFDRQLGRGVLVFQAGTALTVDMVDTDGIFAGGWILPGPQLWLAGLSRAAALPALAPDAESSAEPRHGDRFARRTDRRPTGGCPGRRGRVAQTLKCRRASRNHWRLGTSTGRTRRKRHPLGTGSGIAWLAIIQLCRKTKRTLFMKLSIND